MILAVDGPASRRLKAWLTMFCKVENIIRYSAVKAPCKAYRLTSHYTRSLIANGSQVTLILTDDAVQSGWQRIILPTYASPSAW